MAKIERVPSVPSISRGRALSPKIPRGYRTKGRDDGTIHGVSRLVTRNKSVKGTSEKIPSAAGGVPDADGGEGHRCDPVGQRRARWPSGGEGDLRAE